MRPSASYLLFLAGCSGDTGSVTFTTWGESYIEEGIPADAADQEGFVDGWSLKYSKFIIVLKDISVAKKTGQAGPKQATAKIVDLTKTGPVELLTFSSAPAQSWDHVSYAIAPDGAAEPVGEIAAADVDRMNDERLSLWVEGTATNGTLTKTFSWTFAEDTLFDNCTNNDFGEGVTISAGNNETVQLTVHGDHLWYDDLQADTAKLRWQAYADADKDMDGVVTLHELAAVQLTALPLGQYNTGGAGRVKTLKDFISALVRTIGHYRGEGECEDKARQ